MNRWSTWPSLVALTVFAGTGPAIFAGQPNDTASPSKAGTQVAAVTPSPMVDDAVKDSGAPQKLPVASDQAARLQYVLDFAHDALSHINQDVHDYECQLVKRERVEGDLGNYQYLTVKIRHEQKDGDRVVVPFSVFLRFLKPERMAGREVLFIQNANQGDLIARRGGRRSPNVTVQLPPDSPMAMDGNRYPVTEIGFQNLATRLIEVLEQEQKYNDGLVEIFPTAKLDGRKCTHFRLTHPHRRTDLTYSMAEVSVDDELKIPIYFRSFDWPAEEGGQPRLLEEFFYRNVKLNVGLTDRDFDRQNPDYHFQQLKEVEATASDPDAADAKNSKQAEKAPAQAPAGVPTEDSSYPIDDK